MSKNEEPAQDLLNAPVSMSHLAQLRGLFNTTYQLGKGLQDDSQKAQDLVSKLIILAPVIPQGTDTAELPPASTAYLCSS